MLSILAAEGPNGLQIPSDVNEVYWGTAAFIVLVGLLWWKAGPAIAKGLQGRTERIRGELAAAEAERAEAEAALQASTADLPDVSAEEERIRSEAVATAAKLKDDMAAKAETDAAALVERARSDAEGQRNQALADLREEVARLARDTTEVVVTEQLDAGTQSDLIDQYIRQVAAG